MLVPTSTADGARTRCAGNRSERIGMVAVAPEDWSICLKDARPAYVDWDEFHGEP
jgi:hypothetical protein